MSSSILRNLAVLLILAVSVLHAKPPSARERGGLWLRCGNVGQSCITSYYRGCCPGLVCVPAATRAYCIHL
jgi:hypothetical protein